jgi:hypothetical protein
VPENTIIKGFRDVSAFYFNDSSGVRAPWRFCNLNNGDHGGLAGANGNNTPSNANWNERPRLSE